MAYPIGKNYFSVFNKRLIKTLSFDFHPPASSVRRRSFIERGALGIMGLIMRGSLGVVRLRPTGRETASRSRTNYLTEQRLGTRHDRVSGSSHPLC